MNINIKPKKSNVNLIAITLNALIAFSAFSFYCHEANAQSSSGLTLTNATQTLSDILSSQGPLHHSFSSDNLHVDERDTYQVVSMNDCILTTSGYFDSAVDGSIGHNTMSFTYSTTYPLKDIASIDIETHGNQDMGSQIYDTPVFTVNVHLNNPVLPVRTQFQSTLPDVIKIAAISKVSYVINNANNAQKFSDTLHQMSELCGAPKPVTEQTLTDLPEDVQAHYKQTLAHGKPALMYSTALDMADDGHTGLALQMLQALIEKYPDDAYASKAIDKKEALKAQLKRASSPLSGIRQSAPISSPNLNSNTNSNSNSNNDDNFQKTQCQASCQSTKNSCDMTYSNNMGTQLGNTINSLRGHNSVAAQNSGSQILGDPNACHNEYDSCTARCH
jgi:hypothetical protein